MLEESTNETELEEEEVLGSDDEALLDMLGLNSLKGVVVHENEDSGVDKFGLPKVSDVEISKLVDEYDLFTDKYPSAL